MYEDAADLLIAISNAPDQMLDPTRPRHFSEGTIDMLEMLGYIEECETKPRKLKLTELGEEWAKLQKEGRSHEW